VTCVTSLFLEQVIERFFHVVLTRAGTAAAGVERHTIVGLEEIAKVGPVFLFHIIRLGFSALIAFSGVEESAIFAATSIRLAMRAFILALNFPDTLDFASAAMTNHDAGKDSKLIHYESNH
jgi:hypothetical protein